VLRPTRLSDLSSARQALVRLCQDVNFGQILDLRVRNAEPVWDPAPTVLSEVRLDLLDPSVLELIELTHQPLDLRREFEIGQFAPRSNWI